MHEYVRTAELGQLLERHLTCTGEPVTRIAERADVDARQLRSIQTVDYETTSLWLADRICTALGSHITQLQIVQRSPRRRRVAA